MNFRKLLYFGAFMIGFLLCCTLTSHAGVWRRDSDGWKWKKDNGDYLAGCWWYIENKWYYFHSNGYMAHDRWIGNYYVGSDGAMYRSRLTPDGYMVNGDGHWIPEYYCTNPNERYPGTPYFRKDHLNDNMKDKGSSYEVIAEIIPKPQYVNDVITYSTIFRISKNAVVYDQQGHNIYKQFDFSEYTENNFLFPIGRPEFDKNGYIIKFYVDHES